MGSDKHKVGFKKPPLQHTIKKGEVRNPKGAGAHNQTLKKIRRMSEKELGEIGTLLINGERQALRAICKDPKSTALRCMIAKMALRAIDHGDEKKFNAIMDRIVGKPKSTVELSGKNGAPLSLVDMVKVVEKDKLRKKK